MKKRLCSLFITLIMLFSILIPFPSEAATGAFPVANFTQDFETNIQGNDIAGNYPVDSAENASFKTNTGFSLTRATWATQVKTEIVDKDGNGNNVFKYEVPQGHTSNSRYFMKYDLGSNITSGVIDMSIDFVWSGIQPNLRVNLLGTASSAGINSTAWGLGYVNGYYAQVEGPTTTVMSAPGVRGGFCHLRAVLSYNDAENVWVLESYDNKDPENPILLATKTCSLTDVRYINLFEAYDARSVSSGQAGQGNPKVYIDNFSVTVSSPISDKTFDNDGAYTPETFMTETGLDTTQNIDVSGGKAVLSGTNDIVSYALPKTYNKGTIEVKMSVSDENVTEGGWDLFNFVSADGQKSAKAASRSGAEYIETASQPIATENGMHLLKAVISRTDEANDWELYFFDENDDQNELSRQTISASALTNIAKIELISGNGAISIDDVSFGYYNTLYAAIGSNVRVKVKDAYTRESKKVTFNSSEAIDETTLNKIVVTAPEGPSPMFEASLDEETGKILTLYFPDALGVTGTYTVDLSEVKVLERQIAIDKTVTFEGLKTLQVLSVIDYPTEISQSTQSIDIVFNQEIDTTGLDAVTIKKANGDALSGSTTVTGEGNVITISFDKPSIGSYIVRVSDSLPPYDGLNMAAPFEFEFIVSNTICAENFEAQSFVTDESYSGTQMDALSPDGITWRSNEVGRYVVAASETGNKYIKILTPNAGGGSGINYLHDSDISTGTFEFEGKFAAIGTSNSRIFGAIRGKKADETAQTFETLSLDNTNKFQKRDLGNGHVINHQISVSSPTLVDGFASLKWVIDSPGATKDWTVKLYDMNNLNASGEGTLAFSCDIKREDMACLTGLSWYIYEGTANTTTLAAGIAVDDVKASLSVLGQVTQGCNGAAADATTLTLGIDLEVETDGNKVSLVKVGEEDVVIETTVSYNRATREITLSPKSYLEPGAQYKVIFENGGVAEYVFTTSDSNLNKSGETAINFTTGNGTTTVLPTSGTFDADYSVTVTNNNNTSKDVKVLVMAYDASDRIVKIGSGIGTVSGSNSASVSVTIQGLDGTKVKSFKTFVWEKVDGLGYRLIP